MSRIENALALPMRRNVNPVQLGLGSIVAIAGVLLAIGQLIAGF